MGAKERADEIGSGTVACLGCSALMDIDQCGTCGDEWTPEHRCDPIAVTLAAMGYYPAEIGDIVPVMREAMAAGISYDSLFAFVHAAASQRRIR